MWYLKKMATMPDYDTFKDSVNYIEPNVSYITNDDKVIFNSYVKKTYVYIDERKYEFEGEITYKDFIENNYILCESYNEEYGYSYYYPFYSEYNDTFYSSCNGYKTKLVNENIEPISVNKILEDGDRVFLYGESVIYLDGWEESIKANITWEEQLNWHTLFNPYICEDYESYYIDEEGYVKAERVMVFSDGSLGWCIGGGYGSFYLKYEDGTKVKGTDLTIANHNYKLFSVDELKDFEIRD